MNTYLIANGGCGVRLASVMLTLYQCGFYGYDDPVRGVLVIDNDLLNKSVVHLREIVEDVNDMNDVLKGFNRYIPPIMTAAWAPRFRDAQRVVNLISNESEYEALSLIMTSDELGQTIDGRGFAGHANIGAAYINTIFETGNHDRDTWFFNAFLDEACPKQGGEEARFIIMGSTHGGTGAAFNAAIAKKIRSYYGKTAAAIEIFGLFMQSYYSIPPMGKRAADERDRWDMLHVEPDQFRPSDIEALEGYRDMKLINEENPVFDNILLCGFEPRILTNINHQEGGDRQENRYSVPELIMCAGARCIFEGNTVRNQYLAIDLGNFDGKLRWSNMPYSKELQRCIGSMGLLACSITEENNEAAWNRRLTEKIGTICGYGGFRYLNPVDKERELHVFHRSRNIIRHFADIFWNMLYQMSTNVNETWNDRIVLLKQSAFEGCSRPSGFRWIDDNGADATIIDMDGESFTGVYTPCVIYFDQYFRQILRDNIGERRLLRDRDVDDRVKAYFNALFDASYKTYEEGNK